MGRENYEPAKGHLEDYMPEEGEHDRRARDYLWRDVPWAIWGAPSENGGCLLLSLVEQALEVGKLYRES